MIKIPRSNISQVDICNECKRYISDSTLKTKFSNAIEYLCSQEQVFEAQVMEQRLPERIPDATHVMELTSDEMISMYTQRFVPRECYSRKYYDQIMASTRNGKCPYCGIRIVSTLDHYLPKNVYPELAILYLNLVPACKDCNTDKKGRALTTMADAFLHPYFESINTDDWLKVDFVESNPLNIVYSINETSTLSPSLLMRIENQFRKLNLFELYRVYSINDFIEMSSLFKCLFKSSGGSALSRHFNLIAESVLKEKVFWKYFLYKYASVNEWLCNCYFLE